MNLELEESDIVLGDEIVIIRKPFYYSSGLNSHNPLLSAQFPYRCVVVGKKDMGNHTAIDAGGYGWDLSHLLRDRNVKKVGSCLTVSNPLYIPSFADEVVSLYTTESRGVLSGVPELNKKQLKESFDKIREEGCIIKKAVEPKKHNIDYKDNNYTPF